MSNSCEGCIYDTETCSHPERMKDMLKFFSNSDTDVCHTPPMGIVAAWIETDRALKTTRAVQ